MSITTQSQDVLEVVRVYERLAGQNRWTGVAYDAATGAVVATASRGTRAATRTALEQAAALLAADGSSRARLGFRRGASSQRRPRDGEADRRRAASPARAG